MRARRDANGHLIKRAYGPWVATAYRLLARAKCLRGTPLDIFGYTAERRDERAAIGEFESLARRLASELTTERHPIALELARLPQSVRGFGHVKARNQAAAELRQRRLLAEFNQPSLRQRAVA